MPESRTFRALRALRLLGVLLPAWALAACQGVESTAALSAAAPAAQPASAREYRIAPEDTLDIAVFMVPSLNRSVQVDGSGRIDLPLLGKVAAGGRTVRELEADLAARLGAKYVRSPQVSVSVKEGLAQRFAVDGAVMRPGIYVAKGDTTLLQAIAQAGGPNEVGNIDDVAIVRVVEGRREATRFSLRAIRTGQAADPPVQGQDAVVVGESQALSTLKFVRDLGSPLVGVARVIP